MLKAKIKTHKLGATYSCPHFFILNKGNNEGKASVAHWSNCFVFLADSVDEKEFYYFVFMSMWELGYFRPALIGSVIPFIRLCDLTDIAEEAVNNIITGERLPCDIQQSIQQLEEKRILLLKQVNYIVQIRRLLLANTFIKS